MKRTELDYELILPVYKIPNGGIVTRPNGVVKYRLAHSPKIYSNDKNHKSTGRPPKQLDEYVLVGIDPVQITEIASDTVLKWHIPCEAWAIIKDFYKDEINASSAT